MRFKFAMSKFGAIQRPAPPAGPSLICEGEMIDCGVKKTVRSQFSADSKDMRTISVIAPMAGHPANGNDIFHQPYSPYDLAENELIIDLFCGAGGTSEGALQALGESPAFAVNHNPDAIGVHDINHPSTIHLESDVFAADPARHIPSGKTIGVLLASPACTHFSRAHGGKPLDHAIRDQAWVVANWCEHPNHDYRPRVVIVENVREFLTWAPLTADDKIDKRFIDKSGLGSTFKEWRSRLINAGYKIDYRVLNAADYGVPTSRRRLIIIARRDGLPIRFPEKTHGPRTSIEVTEGKLLPFKSAADCLDFSIKCNPIFMYPSDAKAAGVNRPLADNTLKRIAAGIEKYVIGAEDPFIISTNEIPNQSDNSPIVAAHMAQHNLNNVGHSICEPMSTMTTKVCHQNLVTSHMLTLRQNGFGQSLNEPLSTLCAAGNHHGEVRSSFIRSWSPVACTGQDLKPVPIANLKITEEQRYEGWWIARFLEIYGTSPKENLRTSHLAGPRPSMISRGDKMLWSIQMRMLAPKEAFAASSFPNRYDFGSRADGTPLTKTKQMMLVGNAVPPDLAKAVIAANIKPRPSIARKMAAFHSKAA